MASSSSSAEARSIVSSKLYDAFISHRGPDVKQTLGKQLYHLLKRKGCNPFLDCEEIEGGDCITSAIHNAICSSRVQIAIFSEGFAESSWCLDELVLMLQQTDALFIPIFYGVKPGELRHIDNDKSQYAKAFADYQSKGRYLDKLDGWKKALESASGIFGYPHPERPLEEIVSHVIKFVKDKEKFTPLHVATYPVGLDVLVQRFERCCPNRAGMVGIFGLGGSGKTTLAKQLFNKKSSGYHKSSFLSDVRESNARRELHRLQSQLLKDLFDNDESISNVHHGTGRVEEYLRRGRHLYFLIVMDDIDHLDQVNALLPIDMQGCGSLVIITTREQSVLRGVEARFQMNGMERCHAKNLFCGHAFRGREPPTCYQKLVENFVKYCEGLPLSLKVLGALLYEREEDYWNLVLDKVQKTLPREIMEILKISFDSLEEDEKQIFIDIACFFSNKFGHFGDYNLAQTAISNLRIVDYNLAEKAISIWKACGWSADLALQTLHDKCLIKMTAWDTFEMHDHLRDLGREMADKLGPPRMWQPELLSSMQVKRFQQTLAETKGRYFHSFEDSFLDSIITYFIAETGLVFLEIEGGIKKLDNIPSWISLKKLQHLRINHVEDLWSSFKEQLDTHGQATSELRMLHIEDSGSLQKLPNLIEMCSHLEELKIEGSLEKTDTTSFVQSIKQLSKLRSLHLAGSKGGLFRGNLDLSEGRDSSPSSRMNRLETIELCHLQNIFKLVISEKMCPKLQTLDVRGITNLKEIELKLFMKGVDHSCLEQIRISACPELQSVKGMEELSELKGLVIEVPDNTNGWAGKYIGGLRKLPAKKTILGREVVEEGKQTSSKLNLSLFSEVIDTEAVSEIERQYSLKMESTLHTITIYVLLERLWPPCRNKDDSFFPDHSRSLITVVLAKHDSECRLQTRVLEKGYKVILRFGEEGKALTILQRIFDQLYM